VMERSSWIRRSSFRIRTRSAWSSWANSSLGVHDGRNAQLADSPVVREGVEFSYGICQLALANSADACRIWAPQSRTSRVLSGRQSRLAVARDDVSGMDSSNRLRARRAGS